MVKFLQEARPEAANEDVTLMIARLVRSGDITAIAAAHYLKSLDDEEQEAFSDSCAAS